MTLSLAELKRLSLFNSANKQVVIAENRGFVTRFHSTNFLIKLRTLLIVVNNLFQCVFICESTRVVSQIFQ